VTATAKRRWYQFSLRTLFLAMALVGIVLGIVLPWRAHRRFCLERAQFHRILKEYDGFEHAGLSLQLIDDLVGTDEQFRELIIADLKEQDERQKKEHENHATLAAAYQRAVWRPWERYWIDDPYPFPAPDPALAAENLAPEGARKVLKALFEPDDPEKQQALDALRRKLADESREKYGVP